MFEQGKIVGQYAHTFTARFMWIGIANYDRDTTMRKVLIDKHIDEVAKSHNGVPVVIGHTDPADLPLGDPRIVGRVTNVFLNKDGFTTKHGEFIEADQKYYCDFYVTTDEAAEACARLGFVSCAWEGIEFIRPERNDKGQLEKLTFINNEYEAELKVSRGLHMAIVAEPRYEDAIIYKNSMSQETKEVTSTIEIEKGVYLNYISSKAAEAKDLVLSIFENAKKAKKNEDAYDDDREEEEAKENGKKMKNAKKAKKNESEDEKEEMDKMENGKKAKKKNESEDEKEEKENESVSAAGWSGDWSEDSKGSKGGKKPSEEKDSAKSNSMEVDEEERALVETHRNAKKAKKNESEDKKEEKEEKENSVTKTNGGFALEEARNKIAQPKPKASAYVKGSDLFS